MLTSAILTLSLLAAEPSNQEGLDFFETKIRPVLIEHCYECHSDQSDRLKGALRLDSRIHIHKGGESGPAVVPGDVAKSHLFAAISYTGDFYNMPPAGKLPDRVIADFRQWIEMGAPDPRSDVEPVAVKKKTARQGAGKFWAFQSPSRQPVRHTKEGAWPRSNIDYFVVEKLREAGLTPSRGADRYTLLRRVTFDLTGLPPTPGEIESFAKDPSPDAFEKVVDRLLASTAFGDRWGRHWLDLTCYADLVTSDGHVITLDAWRYRDYVIGALNADKPFDRFILEQVAGDLLPYESDAIRREQLIATGFVAIGPWTLADYEKDQMEADIVDHQIDRIGRVFLGMSLGCARCHDHKFDPIPTNDYYALAGVFHSTQTTEFTGPGVWSQIVRTPVPELSEEARQREQATIENKAALADVRGEREAVTEEKERIEKQLSALQESQAEAAGIEAEKKQLEEALTKVADKIEELDESVRHLEFNRPQAPHALSVRDVEKPADCQVHHRGNLRTLGETVPRGFLTALTIGAMPKVPDGTSGRQELAQWLTSGKNPLTARVMANRIWHHLFGVGLVASVDYFGARGERPSHPELLDYLALRFVEQGWSVKGLIREVVLSRVYRMSSEHDDVAWNIDPDNRLLWRINRRRLEAEAIRDAILAVSGQLNYGRGGPSLGLEILGNVAGLESEVNLPFYSGKKLPDRVVNFRTLYLPLFRRRPTGPVEILSVFDFPHPDRIIGARTSTTVPTQALYLMNSPFLKEQSRRAAERLLAEDGLDDSGRIDRFHRLSLGRPSTDPEVRQALRFLNEFEREGASLPTPLEEPRREAWAQYCHAVLASGDFLLRE